MISKELCKFLEEFFEKELGKPLNLHGLDHDTWIEEMGVDDLDLDVMMQKFIEDYDINCDYFDKRQYFSLGLPIVDNNIAFLRKVFGPRKWLPLAKNELKPFTLGVLDSAMLSGYLK